LHPLSVSLHFLLSAGLIAGTLILVVRAGEVGDEPVRLLVHPAIRNLSRVLVLIALFVLTLGTLVTGSGPHSGDADVTHRLPFDARTISWLHADAVVLFIGLTVGIIVALIVTNSSRTAIARAWWLLGFELAQGVIGYVQFFTGLPWVTVMFHLAGSERAVPVAA
jgi:cytochrome c oxidase assembly protein subunit 15